MWTNYEPDVMKLAINDESRGLITRIYDFALH